MPRVHLTGIKGVGMTALALILKNKGFQVTGSDVSESFITDQTLQNAQIEVMAGFSAKYITPEILHLVHSGAYNHKNSPELQKADQLGIPTFTQQEYLARILEQKSQICVAGVGGKTTTTALLAYLLNQAGKDVGYFVGTGYFSGMPPGKWGKDKVFVVESDEYANLPNFDNTPKLLFLNPTHIVLPNLEHDHPDIYSSPVKTLKVFTKFLQKLPPHGKLYYNHESPLINKLLNLYLPPNTVSIGFHDNSHWRISNIYYNNEHTIVSLFHKGKKLTLKLLLFGRHNVINSVIAASIAHDLGLTWKQITLALASFTGVNRRQEYKGKYRQALFYDDYAHHPKEVAVTLKSFKARFPERKLWVLFESHTYTRTAKFLNDFALALSLADQVSLLPIFASAREKDTSPKVTAATLAKLISKPTTLLSHEDAPSYILTHLSPDHLVLTMGAGIVYKIHDYLPLQK